MVPASRPDLRANWIVALVGSFALIFTLGTPFSYGIFVGPLSETFAISAFAVSIIFSLHLFAAFGVAGIVGVVVTRYSAQATLWVLGGVTLILSPSLYFVDSFGGLLIVFTLLGTTLGSVVIVIVSVVPQWFDEHRGFATGVLFVGIGLSIFILPPVWHQAFTVVAVRDAFFGVIATTAVVFLLAGLVCQHPPWSSPPTISFRALEMWIIRMIRTRTFHYLFFGFGFAFAWFYLLAGYGVAYFEFRGLEGGAAAFGFGLIGGISIVSRLAGGAIADRFGYARTYVVSLGFAVIASGLLLVSGTVALYMAIVFFGISLGGITTLMVPILLHEYDPDMGTAIVGIFSIGLGLAAIAAPPIATTLIAATDSYVPVILLTMATAVVAILLIILGTRVR